MFSFYYVSLYIISAYFCAPCTQLKSQLWSQIRRYRKRCCRSRYEFAIVRAYLSQVSAFGFGMSVLNLKSERVHAYQQVHISGMQGIAQPCTGPHRRSEVHNRSADWLSARSAWFTIISAKRIPPFRERNFDGIMAVAWPSRNITLVITLV